MPIHAIMKLAGRPGDRWASLRKKAGREESPDTVVFAFTPVTKVFGGRRLRLMGNAPGNARGPALRAVRVSEARFRPRTVPQKINRRCNAPRWPSEGKPSDSLKAARASGLRKVTALGKGETVG